MRQRIGDLREQCSDFLKRVSAAVRAFFAGDPRQRDDPTRALFHGVRLRMTLWYSGALVVILLMLGIVLYSATKNLLDSPINSQMTIAARAQSDLWQRFGVAPCNSPPFRRAGVPYVACFGPDGTLLSSNTLAQDVTTFMRSDLVRTALIEGSAQDTIDGGQGLGTISRYAVAVRDPTTGALLGAVQVGISIEGEVRAERTLLTLLLIFGGIMLAVAVGGGFWLSSLALEPARLALERQRAFVTDASHELRTPLTIVRSAAEVLQRARDQMAPDDAELVDDIVTESAYLSRLADRLLLLAQLEGDAVPLQPELCDLGVIARGVARRMTPLAAARAVTMSTSVDDGVIVDGDATLLEEVALILIDNAVKYNRDGGSVRVRVYRDGDEAYLEVADTGPGIDPEHLSRLGERFYRVDKARSRSLGGAGLGLAIARGIAAAHHGSLRLESTPGVGTTVTLHVHWTASSSLVADDAGDSSQDDFMEDE